MSVYEDLYRPGFRCRMMTSQTIRVSPLGVRSLKYFDDAHKFSTTTEFRNKVLDLNDGTGERMKVWCNEHSAPIAMFVMPGRQVDKCDTLRDYLGEIHVKLRNHRMTYEQAIDELESGSWRSPPVVNHGSDVWFASHDEAHLMAFRLTFF